MNTIISNTRVWMLLLCMPLIVISSCKDDAPEDKTIIIKEGPNSADEAQTAFIEADAGTTIIFEEGTFNFTNTLSMDGKNNIIIKGAGRDLTKLNFSTQASGGEGVLISNGSNIRIQDLTIMDSEGDALKTRNIDRISFVNIATIWSGTPSETNGAYGLYPVLCTEVFIDNCYAYGASDAGIYVGQSDQVILKNCVAEGNVAGIEIENTTNADVFDNEAFDNTGGILVFDLPNLTQYGHTVRVFNNNSHDNNRINFAPAGNIVGNVPAGTGFMLLSTNTVEIFGNTFIANEFAGVLIASYNIIGTPNDPNYQSLPYTISIHDNTYSMTAGAVDVANQAQLTQDIIGLLMGNGYQQPNILLDGILVAPQVVCIQENASVSFVNMNATDQTFQSISDDISLHDCNQTPLAAVVFEPF